MSLAVSVRSSVTGFQLRVDFEVGTGITALFGPSGAGKTMTLRAIAGLSRPEAGRIHVSERTLFDSAAGLDVAARHRRIGYLFQQYALFPHLSVARNVAFGLHRLPARERGRRVAEMLSLVGLAGLEERRPAQLSGGQQQRVALARALAPRPDLFLLDEPFAAVDLRVRRGLRDELRRIHQATGTPMLIVTHDLREVLELADSLVVLDAGRVLQVGATREVLAHPSRELQELLDGALP